MTDIVSTFERESGRCYDINITRRAIVTGEAVVSMPSQRTYTYKFTERLPDNAFISVCDFQFTCIYTIPQRDPRLAYQYNYPVAHWLCCDNIDNNAFFPAPILAQFPGNIRIGQRAPQCSYTFSGHSHRRSPLDMTQPCKLTNRNFTNDGGEKLSFWICSGAGWPGLGVGLNQLIAGTPKAATGNIEFDQMAFLVAYMHTFNLILRVTV